MEKLENSGYFQELKTAIDAARKAGEIIDRYADGEANHWKKDDGSSATEADIKAQKAIVEKIKKEFPEDGFLGEEKNLEPEGEERIWIIDPLDGTFNFQKGHPYYCVSIALEVEGEIKLGIIHSPESSLDRTYLGIRNCGSYSFEQNIEDKELLKTSKHSSVQDSIFFATAFDIYEDELEKEKKLLTDLASRGAIHRQLGSAALELSFLASGRTDFLVNPILKKWDYAAGKIIVEEAGGNVRVRESCFPDSYEVVASNGELQTQVEKVVGDLFQ